MSNQEAKLILQAYRLGGRDAGDPQFKEALDQAQRDPELARWQAEEQAIETRIQGKIKSAAVVPAELKNNLLALRKVVHPVPWWKQPVWLAAAAATVLLASLAAFWLRSANAPEFAAFREVMVKNSLQRTDHLTYLSRDMPKIKDWLKAQHVVADFDLPAALRDAPVHGCTIIDWHGQKAALLCFMPNGGGHIDLFVIDRARFRGFKPSETAQFASIAGMTTATWRRENKTYLLAGDMDEQQLKKFL
jgi:hypothetical protein